MGGMLLGLFIMFTVYGGLRRTGVAILTHMLEVEGSSKYVVIPRSTATVTKTPRKTTTTTKEK